jgi:hypothetical protein
MRPVMPALAAEAISWASKSPAIDIVKSVNDQHRREALERQVQHVDCGLPARHRRKTERGEAGEQGAAREHGRVPV